MAARSDFFCVGLFRRYAPAFGFFADFGEAFINAVLGDKLGVGAALGYFAVLDDEDLIGILYRCKTVGDGD